MLSDLPVEKIVFVVIAALGFMVAIATVALKKVEWFKARRMGIPLAIFAWMNAVYGLVLFEGAYGVVSTIMDWSIWIDISITLAIFLLCMGIYIRLTLRKKFNATLFTALFLIPCSIPGIGTVGRAISKTPVQEVAKYSEPAIDALKKGGGIVLENIENKLDPVKFSESLPDFEFAFRRNLGKEEFDKLLADADKHRIAAGAPRRGLTDPELVAIYRYTDDPSKHKTGSLGHQLLNEALASGDAGRIKNVGDFKRTLQAALAKLPDEAGTFWRGVDLTEADRARYVVGKTVTEPFFTSTSATPREAFPGNTLFIVHGKRGKNMVPYSRFPDEAEMLFTADTRFKVLSAERKDSGWVIQLREAE